MNDIHEVILKKVWQTHRNKWLTVCLSTVNEGRITERSVGIYS